MENNKYTATPDWFKPSASELQSLVSTTTQNITNSYTVIGGSSGIKPEQVWELLASDTTELINKTHITDAFSQLSEEYNFITDTDLDGYATLEWIGQQGFVNNSDLESKLGVYVTLNTEQDISAKKHFLNGLTIGNNKKYIYEQDGVLYIDSDVAITGGMTMHALGNRDVSTIMDGIVCDNTTITVNEDGVLSVIGEIGGGIDNIGITGSGNAITSVILTQEGKSLSFTKDETFATAEELNTKFDSISTKLNDFLEGTDTDNIINKWKELEAFLSGMEESDNLAEILSNKADKTELSKFVTLTDEQTITGIKHFTNGLSIGANKHRLYELDGVVYFDGDLAITGGVTAYALGDREVSTIMDGVAVDNTTITIVDGVLKVLNAGGGEAGSVEWANVKNKPSTFTPSAHNHVKSDITDFPTTWSWSNITNKPTTLSGYGITDGVNSVTVNGTGNAITSASISGHILTLTKGSTFLLSSQYTASDILTKLKTVDGANSGLDADTLDGIHANGLFTTLSSNTTTNLSITIGGTTKSIADLAANTAARLQTARTIWGKSFDGTANITGALTSVTDITGTGTFTSANTKVTDSVYINGIRMYKLQDGVVMIEGNLAVTGGITTYAQGEQDVPSGGGGIDAEALWDILGGTGTQQINKTHLTTALNGYATKATTLAGYGITDGVNTVSVTGSGNAVTSASISGHTLTLTKGSTFSLNGHTHNYLPLSGGILTGDLRYSNDATLQIYNQTNTTYGGESVVIQTCFDDQDPKTSSYVTSYANRCNLLLQPRGGQVYIGYNLTTTGNTNYKLFIGGKVYSTSGFVRENSSDSYVLLGGGGHKLVSDFATSGHNHKYLPYQDTRNIDYSPYDSDFNYKGLSSTHLKGNNVDGLNDGGTWHTSLYLYPWGDSSGGPAHNLAFTHNGNMWIRSGTSSWDDWKEIWHSGNDGSGSGLDADLLDGTHKTGLLTALSSNSSTNLSLTVGGTTKTIADLYATYLDGFRIANDTFMYKYNLSKTISSVSTEIYLKVNLTDISWSPDNWKIRISSGYDNINGMLYIDLCGAGSSNNFNYYCTDYNGCNIKYVSRGFSDDWKAVIYLILRKPNTTTNININIYTHSNGSIEVLSSKPSVSWIPIYADYTRTNLYLSSPRTFWGQSFDGTGNVSGNITNCPGISNGDDAITIYANGKQLGFWGSEFRPNGNINNQVDLGANSGRWRNLYLGSNAYIDGNIGIGTTSPSQKLDVSGSIKATGQLLLGNVAGLSILYGYSNSVILNVRSGLTRDTQLCSLGGSIYFKPKGYNSSTGEMVLANTGQLTVKGNILSTGGITCYSSDERAKTVIEKINISLKNIANAPTIRFKWNGWKIKDDNKTHIGGIALYMQMLLPETVLESDGMLNLDYATTGYIFAVLTAKYLTKTNTEVEKLKNRVKKLEKQLKQLGYKEINMED